MNFFDSLELKKWMNGRANQTAKSWLMVLIHLATLHSTYWFNLLAQQQIKINQINWKVKLFIDCWFDLLYFQYQPIKAESTNASL